MVGLDQIKSYYPEHLHGFERFILREYLQYKILELLFESNYANKFVFLGGTALRIVHGNNRFSEDLDFDNFKVTPELFSRVTEAIKYGLQLEGFKVEIRNVFQAVYHCYIRFPKLLYDFRLSGYEEEKILIRLDTVAQDFEFKPVRHLLNRFDVFTEIHVTPIDILLSQKLLTILERKRSKGRDFYDVVYLLGRNTGVNYDYLSKKASIVNGSQLKEVIMDRTESLNMTEMANDVKPFLIHKKEIKKIESFREYILQVRL